LVLGQLDAYRSPRVVARQQDVLYEWQDSDLVFATAIGTAMDAPNVRPSGEASVGTYNPGSTGWS